MMNPNTIREFASSFQKSRILLSGFELDIFTNIDEPGSANNQIASRLHLNEHACERLLNALVSVGFLRKQNNLFFNTPESFMFLSKKSTEYLGGLMHSNHLWNTWSNLTQVVKTGKSAQPAEINERGDDWLFPFINAMHDRAKKQAPQQLAGIDLSEVNTVLDIGGGSGAYSMEFISKKPEIEATVFDLPNVVPITRKFLEKEGCSDKIKTFSGDYTTDDLPKGFDLVFLSAIIHSNPLETNRELVKKCYGSLNKKGRIIIQDWIMNNERTQPVAGAVFAINMLVGTEAGDCFTELEVTEILTAAGFKNISKTEFETGLGQMIAQKI
ncbi:MAG: methyltransferase domain-containing protein [Bacteroidales bacterium]|nr:methyltransferase domain-containing protein [Bacteroidales bacterium]